MDPEPLMTSQGAIFAELRVLVRTVFRLYNSGGTDTVVFYITWNLYEWVFVVFK